MSKQLNHLEGSLSSSDENWDKVVDIGPDLLKAGLGAILMYILINGERV